MAPGGPFLGGKLIARSLIPGRPRRQKRASVCLQPPANPNCMATGPGGGTGHGLVTPGARLKGPSGTKGLKNNQKRKRIRTFFWFLPITQEQAPGPGSQAARGPGLGLHRWPVCVQTQPPAPWTCHWAVPQPRPQRSCTHSHTTSHSAAHEAADIQGQHTWESPYSSPHRPLIS